MKKISLLFGALLFLLGASVLAVAQEKGTEASAADTTQPGMYRLDFVVKELDGAKVVNTRSYSVVVQSPELKGNQRAKVRAGTKVPVAIGGKEGSMQWQYMDVGVDITTYLSKRAAGGPILMNVDFEISSLAMPEQAAQGPGQPIVRTANSSMGGILVTGKALMIGSVDDPATNRRFTIEVTPTKLM